MPYDQWEGFEEPSYHEPGSHPDTPEMEDALLFVNLIGCTWETAQEAKRIFGSAANYKKFCHYLHEEQGKPESKRRGGNVVWRAQLDGLDFDEITVRQLVNKALADGQELGAALKRHVGDHSGAFR